MVTAAAARKRAAATVVVTAAAMMVGGGYSLARDADRARGVSCAEVCVSCILQCMYADRVRDVDVRVWLEMMMSSHTTIVVQYMPSLS